VGDITALIYAAHRGDRDALDRLFSLLYDDLHRLAHARVRASGPDRLLDTTSLVHETYARFADAGELGSVDRQQFFGYVARVDEDLVRLVEMRYFAGLQVHIEMAWTTAERT
jgi:hypothetical protein